MSNAANPTTGTIWPVASPGTCITDATNKAPQRTVAAVSMASQQTYSAPGKQTQVNTVKLR